MKSSLGEKRYGVVAQEIQDKYPETLKPIKEILDEIKEQRKLFAKQIEDASKNKKEET